METKCEDNAAQSRLQTFDVSAFICVSWNTVGALRRNLLSLSCQELHQLPPEVWEAYDAGYTVTYLPLRTGR